MSRSQESGGKLGGGGPAPVSSLLYSLTPHSNPSPKELGTWGLLGTFVIPKEQRK